MNISEKFNISSKAKQDGFLRMKQLKEDSGKKVVGIFCSYTPIELILAADAVPISLCGTSEDGIAFAERTLPQTLCPMIKSSYGLAASDSCPYFYFSDMILAETTCDGKKKMYEYMAKLKPTHVMQLPPGRTGYKCLDFWHGEVLRAKEAIEENLKVEITEDKVREAIKEHNNFRRALLDFYEIGKLNPCPLPGYEISKVFESTHFMFNEEEKIATLKNITKSVYEEWKEAKGENRKYKPRILITGCPTGGLQDKIIKKLEDLSVDVVAFESCSGPRCQELLVDENKDPYWALAEKYLQVSCSVMSPNPDRLSSLKRMIDEYQIDGVVEVILHACHTFAVEAAMIRDFVTKECDKPYICIETDYSESDTGQIKTRLGAFKEILEANL